jgi:transcriptional regulator with XRE-family HTH domain
VILVLTIRAGKVGQAVAERMGTTKSAVSPLEAGGRHSPSVTTLKKYAHAVGCEVEIRLVPAPRQTVRARRGRLGRR